MKELLMAMGGVRSIKKKLAGRDEEATIFYNAPTATQVAGVRGAISTFEVNEAGLIARDRYAGKFLLSVLADETGAPLMTAEEVARIPDVLKLELCLAIINDASTAGEAGKG